MLILCDHGTPQGLIHALPGHTVHTAQAKGWDTLSNGALLNALEAAGFELCSGPTGAFATSRTCKDAASPSVVLTGTTSWSLVRQRRERIAAAVTSATPGSYSEVEIPFEPKPGRA